MFKSVHYCCAVLVLVLAAASTAAAAEAELVTIRKIWDQAKHNGFPSLSRIGGQWYCTFREAEHHVGGEDGKMRILTSSDGEAWESAALVTEEGVDLREGNVTAMPDGRLMLTVGGSIYEDIEVDGRTVVNGRYVTRQSRVSFSQDGKHWTPLRKILADGDWLWRVTWHKGTAYGLSKVGFDANPKIGILTGVPRGGFLYSSKNGLDWELITEFNVPRVSETKLCFSPDDEMIALIRHGHIGTSRPPYRDWTFHAVEVPIAGPDLIRLPNGSLWASTRNYQPLTEAEKVRTNKPKAARTVLANVSREGDFDVALTLPSFGDTGYAGLVWHDELLWMAYYSSHEGRTSIYLAKIRIKG